MGERVNLSGNAIATTWREGDWIYKQQPKHFAQNEYYALTHPALHKYTPGCAKLDDEKICMTDIQTELVTDAAAFLSHYWLVLHALKSAGLRHGDLTEPHVLVVNNRPIIIDWAESRLWDDPRPDKRIEGDAYWLRKTMEALCQSET